MVCDLTLFSLKSHHECILAKNVYTFEKVFVTIVVATEALNNAKISLKLSVCARNNDSTSFVMSTGTFMKRINVLLT